jgi:hypothetical protein
MSSALAIASVTAVLKNLLDNELIHQSTTMSVGDVTVSALPPDRIPTGAEERAQLNLYVYRLTPNSGRLCKRPPDVFAGTSASQEEPSDSSPLALDLHYLLTAYGERDFQAEILLGHAMQLLHETPILTREVVRSALASISTGNASGNWSAPGRFSTVGVVPALSASTLADQLEEIKISPEFLNMEEMSKLWSSLQTRSRPSVTYQVSTILIEDRRKRPPDVFANGTGQDNRYRQ